MECQNSVSESTPKLYGVNVFNGNESYVQFHPRIEDWGLAFKVGNVLIEADIDQAFLYSSPRSLWMSHSIGVGNKSQKALHIEHLLADVYASGMDNLVIELSDGVGTRYDFDENRILETLLEYKTPQNSPRKIYRLKKGLPNPETSIHDKRRGERLSIERSDGFVVEYITEYPHKSIGKQHHSFEVNLKNYMNEIRYARAIFFMPPIPEIVLRKLIKPFYGVNDRNSLLIGNKDESHFRNLEVPGGIYGKEEFVRHKIMDGLGTIALLGMNFDGITFRFEKTGHKFDIRALREFKKRGVFERVE